jgi:cytochrome c oxidase assembly protein subunit 11
MTDTDDTNGSQAPRDASDEPSSAPPAPPSETTDEEQRKTTRRLVIGMVAMFLFAWALVPLFWQVCKQLDPGGSSSDNGSTQAYGDVEVDESRTIRVRFATNVKRDLPWTFRPGRAFVDVHPGEKKLVNFTSENLDDSYDIKGKAVYDVNPPAAAEYLNKIECFCFKEQTLEAGQRRKMPFYFWFDPEIPERIDRVKISYTFFNVDSSRKRAERQNQ